MAFQMAYTDIYGNTHAESYWRVVQVNISVPDRSALFCLYGYKDVNARNASKMHIGQKTYNVSGDNFDGYLTAHFEPGGPNIAAMTYNYAASCEDVETEDPEVKVSFFAGATSV